MGAPSKKGADAKPTTWAAFDDAASRRVYEAARRAVAKDVVEAVSLSGAEPGREQNVAAPSRLRVRWSQSRRVSERLVGISATFGSGLDRASPRLH